MHEKPTYYWVWKIHQGRPVVRGWYTTEQEARQRGLTDLGMDFEVIALKTRDEAKAKGAIKDIILKRTGSLDIALRRFRNKIA